MKWMSAQSFPCSYKHRPPPNPNLIPVRGLLYAPCNVCFVNKVIEIFREGADSCLRLCWVGKFSLSQTCDGKSRGSRNGRSSPGVNQRNAAKSRRLHCFWHWSFSRQLKEASEDWYSALPIPPYHPVSLSLCLNQDFRGFPVGAAKAFLCHPPLSLQQLHIPASVRPRWQSRFLHFHKKEKAFFIWFAIFLPFEKYFPFPAFLLAWRCAGSEGQRPDSSVN